MTLVRLLGCLVLLCLVGAFVGFGGVLGLLIKFVMIAIVCYGLFWLVVLGGIVMVFKWLVATLTGNGVL